MHPTQLCTVLVVASISQVSATTCQQRAANCVRIGGESVRAQCFAPDRMAQCRKAGVYSAPSGRDWEASDH